MPNWDQETIINQVKQNLVDKLEVIGGFVEGAARLLCPADTHNLERSLTHKVIAEDQSVIIGSPVEYAPFVELGTYKMEAQPYLRPAVLDNKQEIMKILKQ